MKTIYPVLLLTLSSATLLAQPSATGNITNSVISPSTNAVRRVIPGRLNRTNFIVGPSQVTSGTNGVIVETTATNTVITPLVQAPLQTPVRTTTGTNSIAVGVTNSVIEVPRPAPLTAAPGPAAVANTRTGVSAQAVAKTEEPLTIKDWNYPAGIALEQVFKMYAELTQKVILRGAQGASAINPQMAAQPVYLETRIPLTRTEGIMVLETIMEMNGITVIPIGEKFIKIVPEQAASINGAKFSDVPADELPDAGKYVTKMVTLKYIAVQDALQAIQSIARAPSGIIALPNSATIILRDYSENLKRSLEVLEAIDVPPESDYKLAVIPIKYGKVEEMYNTMNSLITGSAVSPSAGTAGRTGRAGGGLGQGANGQSRTTGALQSLQNNPGGAQANFASRLNNIANRAGAGGAGAQGSLLGDARIVPDRNSNSLLVFANKQDLEMITNLVAKVDVLLSQVLIEAIIMEVTLDKGQTFGVNYLQHPKVFGDVSTAGGLRNNNLPFLGSVTNLASSLPSGFSYFGQIGNNFDISLAALANNNSVNVISRPRIQTTHAVQASFSIGTSVPYITGTQIGFNGTPSSQYQEKDVATRLDVTPYITPDGLVVMEISQTIDQLGAPTTIDGNSVPTINKREALSTVSVKDGETIMLGGFITSNKTKSRAGIPYLKDIPYLGALFRSNTDTMTRTELIVLIRPKVLPTAEAAALAAAVDQNRLPLVKKAEVENFEEEKALRIKTDKELQGRKVDKDF
ncbi:MAG: Type and secretion system protein [Verrucomicrobiales bacterium]|nr:Type and secretion system protein [Verrucomicrobiales bacterium]